MRDHPAQRSEITRPFEWKEAPAGGQAQAVIPWRAPANRWPASFAQRRIWFLDRLQRESAFYAEVTAWRFSGALQPALLAQALRAVIERHESLRTVFSLDGDTVYQHVRPAIDFGCPVVDLSDLDEDSRQVSSAEMMRAFANHRFDLSASPLLRATLLRQSSESYVLLPAIHHIAHDGWSMSVLVRELGAFYRAAVEGRPAELPPLPIQYADFAVHEPTPTMQARRTIFWGGALGATGGQRSAMAANLLACSGVSRASGGPT